MKTPLTGPLLAGALLASLSCGAWAEPRTYEIDPEHFSIGFLTDHAGYERILGMFLEGEGEFVYDEESRELSSGEVIIESESVFTNHEERDDHLREDDFLAADDHPEIRFTATGFEAESDDRGTLQGDLTLLGRTRPVSLDITLNKAERYPFGHEEYVLGLSARTTINRSEWGMDYGIADNLVGDEVELILEFEAIRQ